MLDNPNPPKNRLWASFMGLCPKPHSLFEKSESKTFICLRRIKDNKPCKNDSFCVSGSKGMIPLAGFGTESREGS